MFPLFVRAIGIITSIIGIVTVVSPRSETESGMKAINRGFFISAAASAVGVVRLCRRLHEGPPGVLGGACSAWSWPA